MHLIIALVIGILFGAIIAIFIMKIKTAGVLYISEMDSGVYLSLELSENLDNIRDKKQIRFKINKNTNSQK